MHLSNVVRPVAVLVGMWGVSGMAIAEGTGGLVWDKGSETLEYGGRPLLELAAPDAPKAMPQAGLWMADEGRLQITSLPAADCGAVGPSPVETNGAYTVRGRVTIDGAGAVGLAVLADRSGQTCYAVLLDVGSKRVRTVRLPYPGADLTSEPYELVRGEPYLVEMRVEATANQVSIVATVDGAQVARYTAAENHAGGAHVGVIANFARAVVSDLEVLDATGGVLQRVTSLWSDGEAPHYGVLDVDYADGAFSLRGRLPEEGRGLGAVASFRHRVDNATEISLPHLCPDGGYVIGDHVFRSPAVVLANDKVALAVIADVDEVARLQREAGVRVWLDYDHRTQTITLCCGHYVLADQHVLFWPNEMDYAGQEVFARLHVFASDAPPDVADPYGMAARWMWDKWGHPAHARGGSQRASFETYMRHITRWAFTPEPEGWGDTVWQEFTVGERQCGAPAFIVDVAQHMSIPYEDRRWREQRSVWNQAWFSTQRCANGLFRLARQSDDAELERRARLMTQVALAAPQTNGLFPAVYSVGGGRYSLYTETPDWDSGYWTNSNRRPREASAKACHILDAAFTCRLLLEWYGLTGDREAVAYIRPFADRLVRLQLPSGAYPGWVEPSGDVCPVLAEGPETAMGATLLLELCEAGVFTDREPKYQASAVRALKYRADGPGAEGRGEDFETYFSCSSWGRDWIGQKIERNGIYKRNTFSPFWCAEAFLAAYRLLDDDRYLSIGRRCLDELSLYQQVWDPPFIPTLGHGGFGVMNGDGEWNDARQSLFAPLYLQYYRVTGEPEYFERGVAALRASFIMLYCPEHEAVAREYERRHPMFGPESYGFMMENVAHGGPGAEPIGPFTIFTWGNGAALESAAKIHDLVGDVYVDTARGRAFGVDGCTAEVVGDRVTIRDLVGTPSVTVVYSDGGRREVAVANGAATTPLRP